LLQIVLNTIRKHDLIPTGSKVVVGVSGGADSLALLHVLYTLREQLDCQLHVATLDHGLRGEASAEDVRFVVDICKQWGIPVTAEHVNVTELAQHSKHGIEAEARRVRYHFLTQVAQQVGTSDVAVAHHANDQAETLLMRITRGTGTRGLQGMSVKAEYWEGVIPVALIRPLLNVTRAEVEAYCRENDLHPRHDATNDDLDYTRNYMRHEILPRLQVVNPQVVHALNRLSETAAIELDFLWRAFQTQVVPHINWRHDLIIYSRSDFGALHPYMQRRFIQWAIMTLQRSEDISFERIVAAVELAQTGQVGAIAELPHDLQLRLDYDTLVIERRSASLVSSTKVLLNKEREFSVDIPGRLDTLLYDWILVNSLSPVEFPASRLAIPEGAQVILRTRRQGERFAPLGLNGHTQKLSEWMVNHKVPRAIRDNVPLLVVDGEVAAILYGEQWTISHHFAVREESKRVVYFAKH
jgi:tRNA(Ile)-lysidine synthase